MRAALALWRSTHPGPTLVVTALSLGLGIAAGLDAWRVVVLVVAVFCGQLSIGLSNDAIDSDRDRQVGRTDKPIAHGDVSLRAAWIAALATLVVALALTGWLGWEAAVAHGILLASAWAYNAGLKSTAVSIVPFLVSFGLFPSVATLSAAEPALAAWWASLAGAVLGAAVHLTNVLPDLDDDRETGVRGFPHRIGARWSAVLAAGGILAGAVAVVWGSAGGDLDKVSVLSWVFSAMVLLAAIATVVLAVIRAPGRVLFRLVMGAALLLALQLVLSGGTLAA
ncbi:UbiA family prenyltransferase [Microbacterium sp.]|jgi:4-hydroxybenzoate polyprenyltransferase|uniref:UbiA family prenyltransferase n=1 Tax=Microbacterium sp. TaxID=51671 RepID=UPI002720035E|nr:UbiA family prenyltransferase [Microbacterium sp.]MDO8383514.1 UbiA family prenyltransferase [Microbacterium sp.]